MAKDMITLLSEDEDIVPYRKSLRSICKNSVTATILLSQMMYRAKRHLKKYGKEKFYKFKQPCKHVLCKEGDSWCEELGFSREEFDTALSKIGFKLGKANKTNKESERKREEKKNNSFIHYYTDSKRLTWYKLNHNALNDALTALYLVECDSHFSKVKCDSHFTTNTETTSKTTSFSSKEEKCDSGESHILGGNSSEQDGVRKCSSKTQTNNVEHSAKSYPREKKKKNAESSLNTSDRLANKPKKIPKSKYKHNTIVEKCYIEAVNLKATNHKRDKDGNLTQAGINTFDKIYELLNPKMKNPYSYANNLTEEYVAKKWTADDLLDSFEFHMKYCPKNKQVRNISNFIFSQDFKGTKSWSPLITWHSAMKQGITGELDKDGEYLFKILNQNKVRDLANLSAETVNRLAQEINTAKQTHELFDGTEHNSTYPSGLITVFAKYVKAKTNDSNYEIVWVNKKTFIKEFLVEAIKRSAIKKKSKIRNINFA